MSRLRRARPNNKLGTRQPSRPLVEVEPVKDGLGSRRRTLSGVWRRRSWHGRLTGRIGRCGRGAMSRSGESLGRRGCQRHPPLHGGAIERSLRSRLRNRGWLGTNSRAHSAFRLGGAERHREMEAPELGEGRVATRAGQRTVETSCDGVTEAAKPLWMAQVIDRGGVHRTDVQRAARPGDRDHQKLHE